MTEPTKQLGDDWTEETQIGQVLGDVNNAFIALLAARAYRTTEKFTVTVPARWIDRLKIKTVPYTGSNTPFGRLPGPERPPMSWLAYIGHNNILANEGAEWEILPRYSFADVKGMVDESWIGKRAAESDVKFTDAVRDWVKLCRICGYVESYDTHTDRTLLDFHAFFEAEGPEQMPSGPMYQTKILERIQSAEAAGFLIRPEGYDRFTVITGSRGGGKTAKQAEELEERRAKAVWSADDAKAASGTKPRVTETKYAVRVDSAFVKRIEERLGATDWGWPAKASICEEVIAAYLELKEKTEGK